jgi:hypothetical protein
MTMMQPEPQRSPEYTEEYHPTYRSQIAGRTEIRQEQAARQKAERQRLAREAERQRLARSTSALY